MKARVLLILVLIGMVLLGVGCSTTIIDSGTQRSATYSLGKLTTQAPRDIATVYAASEKAMMDLGLNIIQKHQDKLEAELFARDAQDKKITVKLTAATADATDIAISTWSTDKARRLNEAIQANLPK